MKILLLAPQPFYQERGTPIAVKLVARTLCQRSDEVDLLCYHEGMTVDLPGMRLFRIPNLPFVKNVGPGPTWKKAVCDAIFFFSALKLVCKRRYELIHAVEESVYIARVFKFLFGTPYVYDMDSSIAEQIVEKFPKLSVLSRFLARCEAWAVRGAEAVVPVCDALADVARRSSPKRCVLLRDISLLELNGNQAVDACLLDRAEGKGPVAMYIGNLETYQGIDLLLQSFAIAAPMVPGAQLVLIGGQEGSIARYRRMAENLGIGERAHFLGPKPVAQLGAYMKRADVLVSPRIKGKNTPMKIYSYLDSGKAVLATDLPTHRQAVSEEVALLAPIDPRGFALGLVKLLNDSDLRERLGKSARTLVAQKHSYAAFKTTLVGLYSELESALTKFESPNHSRRN